MRGTRQILDERLGRVGRGDLAVADHRVEHRLLALLGRRPVDQGVVDRRPADDPGQHRGLRQVQLVGGGVEVDLRRGRGAPCGVGEKDAVQIPLEDLVLRVLALDLEREQRLTHLAVERRVVADKAQLHQLLGDRRRALGVRVRPEVDDRGTHDALWVDSRLRVEVTVFDRDHCRGQEAAHLGQRLEVRLITGRVKVGQQRRVVRRVNQRVLGGS